MEGRWEDQFVVDPFQAGAGTSHHMNINEVIANRATELMGGGMSISRHYYVEGSEKEVDIEVVTDSPLLQAVMMWLSNPMFAAMGGDTGKKPIKVDGNKAMLEFNQEEGTGELQMVVGTKTLLTVKGRGLDRSDVLVEYAKRVDTAKLKELVGE